jgi:hypothetical protein
MQGNEDEAVRTLEDSLELTLYMLKGDYTRGRSLLEQALAMFQALEDSASAAVAFHTLTQLIELQRGEREREFWGYTPAPP